MKADDGSLVVKSGERRTKGFLYSVQSPQQVFPVALLEVEFVAVGPQTPAFQCEMCERNLMFLVMVVDINSHLILSSLELVLSRVPWVAASAY